MSKQEKFSNAITEPAAIVEAFGRLQGRRGAVQNRLDAARLKAAVAKGGAAERHAWKVEVLEEVVREFDFAIANFSEGLDIERCSLLYSAASARQSKP